MGAHLGAGLLAWSFLGRFLVLACFAAGKDEPREERGEARIVHAPDGSALNVESFGRADGPTLVFTHGWGLNSTAWGRARRDLAARYRLVTWDLPGLGRSKPPKDGRFTIDRFAEALGAVVQSTGADRVVLVGHSIGGMTTQTVWRACPAELKAKIAGLVLLDTTHENPLMTMWLCAPVASPALAADRADVVDHHRPVAPRLARQLAELSRAAPPSWPCA